LWRRGAERRGVAFMGGGGRVAAGGAGRRAGQAGWQAGRRAGG